MIILNTTFQLKKSNRCWTFPIRRFIVGLNQTKYVLLKLHSDKKDTILTIYKELLISLLLLLKRKKSVTVESLPLNKWMTLTDNKIFLDKNSLIMSWLQTSVQGLIGNEKDLEPFWNEQCLETSPRWWLPTEIGSVASPTNCLNSSFRNIKSKSWFSTKILSNPQTLNSLMTSSLLSPSTPVEQWEKEDIVARKIRIYPNQHQKKVFKEWFGVRRFVYNKVLSAIENDNEKINFMSLRNKHVTLKNNDSIQPFEVNVPKDIRAGAIRDLVKNYNTAFSLLKKKQVSHFKMSYSRKKDTPSIEIPKTAIDWSQQKIGIDIYKKKELGKIKVSKRQSKKDHIPKPTHDCRLMCKDDQWYLVIPMDKKRNRHPSSLKQEICALDPGIKTFQTIYSNDNVVKISKDPLVLKRLQQKLDLLQSLRSKKKIKQSRYTRNRKRLYRRQSNLINELHFKTASYLTDNYKTIILPTFESQKMTKNSKRRQANRNLLELQHYKFKERLKEKCLQRNCQLHICTEEYTSKTCGRCGKIEALKNYDVFECYQCGLKIDRDTNGARNIMLKYLCT